MKEESGFLVYPELEVDFVQAFLEGFVALFCKNTIIYRSQLILIAIICIRKQIACSDLLLLLK
jgi:hypothetical protein